MSNEKPVRITVGDVREVTEATTIQSESPVSRPASSVSYKASVPDNSGNGMVMAGGLVGFILFVLAGYFGLVHGVTPDAASTSNAKSSSATTKAVAATDQKAPATNAPAPSGTATNSPAPDKAMANNAPPTATNAPATKDSSTNAQTAATNAPPTKDAGTNASSANNAPK